MVQVHLNESHPPKKKNCDGFLLVKFVRDNTAQCVSYRNAGQNETNNARPGIKRRAEMASNKLDCIMQKLEIKTVAPVMKIDLGLFESDLEICPRHAPDININSWSAGIIFSAIRIVPFSFSIRIVFRLTMLTTCSIKSLPNHFLVMLI